MPVSPMAADAGHTIRRRIAPRNGDGTNEQRRGGNHGKLTDERRFAMTRGAD